MIGPGDVAAEVHQVPGGAIIAHFHLPAARAAVRGVGARRDAVGVEELRAVVVEGEHVVGRRSIDVPLVVSCAVPKVRAKLVPVVVLVRTTHRAVEGAVCTAGHQVHKGVEVIRLHRLIAEVDLNGEHGGSAQQAAAGERALESVGAIISRGSRGIGGVSREVLSVDLLAVGVHDDAEAAVDGELKCSKTSEVSNRHGMTVVASDRLGTRGGEDALLRRGPLAIIESSAHPVFCIGVFVLPERLFGERVERHETKFSAIVLV